MIGNFVFVSIDNGDSWEISNLPDDCEIEGIVQSDSAIYALAFTGSTNEIFRTIDLGVSWESLNYTGGEIYTSDYIVPYNESLLVLVSGWDPTTPCLFWSNDEWETRGTIPAGFFVQVARVSCGQDLGYTWYDSGLEIPFEPGNNGFGDVAYDCAMNRVWVSTGCGTAFIDVEDISENASPDRPNPSIPELDLLRAFPNPFNGTTHIEFSVRKAQRIELVLYDLSGRMVSKMIDQVFEPGTHSRELDLNAFPAGTYFLSERGLEKTSSLKLILLR
jgi:hypothetical protein